jgi:hypothetical protein
MDEPSSILGPKHRKYRHDPHTTPIVARKLFGENADNACLDHIRLDELETRRKVNKNEITINVSIGKAKQPQLDPLRFGVFSLLTFVFGFLLISQNIGMATLLFIFSFFLFIAFIGSLSSKNMEDTKNTSEEQGNQDE